MAYNLGKTDEKIKRLHFWSLALLKQARLIIFTTVHCKMIYIPHNQSFKNSVSVNTYISSKAARPLKVYESTVVISLSLKNLRAYIHDKVISLMSLLNVSKCFTYLPR